MVQSQPVLMRPPQTNTRLVPMSVPFRQHPSDNSQDLFKTARGWPVVQGDHQCCCVTTTAQSAAPDLDCGVSMETLPPELDKFLVELPREEVTVEIPRVVIPSMECRTPKRLVP